MRKSYRDEEREELVEEVAKGRATVAEAADRRGVAISTAYFWVRSSRAETRQARRAGRKPKLTREATFVELVPRARLSSAIAIRIGGAEIEVRPGFDVELLRAVVAAMTGRVE